MAEPHFDTNAPHHRQVRNKRKTPTIAIVILMLVAVAAAYMGGLITGGGLDSALWRIRGQKDLDLAKVQDTYRALKNNYDGDLDTAKLIEGASRGMVEAVGDDYTVFMNGEEATEFDNSLTGNIGGGIGVEIGIRNDVPTAVRVLQDNPAQKAGVMVNDIIAQVNGEDTLDQSVNDIVTKIRGEEGTTVKLTVLRNGELKEFNITRAIVTNPSAYGEVRGTVGIMTITRFDQDTGSLARAVANDFKRQNVTGVVLDLRGNGGGYVNAAQSVAGIWLDNQVVVTERSGGRVTDELRSSSNPILEGVPTIVLVNESSASASEIVAGALHDYDAASLLGTTTFGKGSVQKLVNLKDDAVLKVTIARWYTPKGLNISEKGIDPDKHVERTADDVNASRDPQLDSALGSLQ
jgi:carboxyl-terminal processing protease